MFQKSVLTRIRNVVAREFKKPIFYTVYRTTGVRIQSEVHYSDLSMIEAVFTISASAVKGILPSNKLIPAERANGVTDINFVALEYRSIDILFPYNEFAVCIPVIYKIDDDAEELHGYYYLYLPVTTKDARWGGVENLGLPKFVAEISFVDTAESRSCTLKADNKEIITLTVKRLPIKSQSWEFSNFGIRNGKLVRNIFEVHGQGGTGTAVGGAMYTLGDHPISRNLEALGIGQSAIQYEYVPKAQAVLSKSIGSPLPLD